jgi:membrane protease YdiL (CAAX protease family)
MEAVEDDPGPAKPGSAAANGAASGGASAGADPSRSYVVAWSILALLVALGASHLVRRLLHVSAPLTYVLEELLFSGTLAFFAIYQSQEAVEGWRRRLLLVKPTVSGAGLALILLSNWGLLVLGTPLYLLGELLFGESASSESFGTLFDAAPPAWRVVLATVIAVGPAIGEELLFRGYLQTGLLRSFRPAVAILIAALLFSSGHPPGPRAMSFIPLALWVGFITLRTGSLLPAVLSHLLTNLTPTLTSAASIDPMHVIGVGALVGAVSFPLALRALRHTGIGNPGAIAFGKSPDR